VSDLIRRCVCCLVMLVLSSQMAAAASDQLTDLLKDVQKRRDLHVVGEGDVANRIWSRPDTRQSLHEYIEARQLLLRGQDAAGLGMLSSATNFDPDNGAAWRMVALYWEGLGRADYAEQAWKQVGRINPQDVDAQYFLGLEAAERDDLEQAAALLLSWRLGGGKNVMLKSTRPRPDKVMRGEALLASLLYQIDEPQAAESLRQSLRRDIDAMINGRSRYQMGQDKWFDLISLFQTDGSQHSAFDALVVLYNLPQMKPKTRNDLFDMAVGVAVLFDDGSELSSLVDQMPEKTLEILVPQPTGDSAAAELLFQVAMLYSNMGNRDGAAWLYEDVLEHEPMNVMARNNLAYYEMVNGRLDSNVIRMIRTAWRDAPEQPAILDTYGWLQYLLGRFEDDDEGPGAISLLEEAHRRTADQPSPEILDHLGDAFYRVGRVDDARDAWTSALAILLDPRHRQEAVRLNQEIQGTIWGRRIRDPNELYDLAFGSLELNLESKLAALKTGEPCPVQPLVDLESR